MKGVRDLTEPVKIDLDKLEELCKQAMEAQRGIIDAGIIGAFITSGDLEFLLAAHEALPQLIAQLRAQEKALELAEEALERAGIDKENGDNRRYYCIFCKTYDPDRVGHTNLFAAPACPMPMLEQALATIKEARGENA